MAVADKTFNLAESDGQRIAFSNVNTAQSKVTATVVLRDADVFPVTVKFYQGNIANLINTDTNQLSGEDYMSEIMDCENEQPVELVMEANGNYHIILDTYSARFGNAVVFAPLAEAGTARIVIAVPNKPN